jgi:ribonuclease HII
VAASIVGVVRKSGARLLSFDRKLGARYVAGVDEAGRGSLAGPLVIGGVLFDYQRLRDHAVRPLALLNDSKQVGPEDRERLFHAVAACATKIIVRVVPSEGIDRDGLHRSNLRALREALAALTPPAEVCLVDGFRLGPLAPQHQAVVDGDTKSAAIAAASIVAKVSRDRAMRRLDALFPHYGFASHVGYITPRHSAAVRERGPSVQHRRSFQALCYADELEAAASRA